MCVNGWMWQVCCKALWVVNKLEQRYRNAGPFTIYSDIQSKDFGTGPCGADRDSFSSWLNWSEAGSRRGESSRPLPESLFSAACAFKHTRNFPAALGSARHRPLSLRLHRRADWPTALIRVLSAICRIYWTSSAGSLEASSSRTMQAIKCVVVGDG